MMTGALVFLGCPLRAILRLAGGDLNGLTGLVGFVAGVGAGTVFLRRGYHLGKPATFAGVSSVAGYGVPLVAFLLVVAAAVRAPFLKFSVQGPGSMHAPLMVSLAAGIATGLLAQRARVCLSGGFRDYILLSKTYLLGIYAVIFLAALAGNSYLGFFKLGFRGQPLAHSMHLWNFLGLFLVGMAATLAGGCPLRQLILSGEGSTDAVWCVFGMLAGAAIAHGFNTAGSATGVNVGGQAAVITGIVATVAIGFLFTKRLAAVP